MWLFSLIVNQWHDEAIAKTTSWPRFLEDDDAVQRRRRHCKDVKYNIATSPLYYDMQPVQAIEEYETD